MLGNYFYNATIKRVVSVFGTLFNNVKIARHDSTNKQTNQIHVPISYGPKEKFLARIRGGEAGLREGTTGLAIKLPRMSFEMTSIDYDSSIKLNKLNKIHVGNIAESFTSGTRSTLFQSVPYNIGMSLSIYSKNQDDALQILEQILPTFNPEYTVTIKDIDGPNSKTDVPFILNGIGLEDDYEGDLQTRRAVIYTLDFTIKARFAPGVGRSAVIKRVQTQLADFTILSSEDQSPKDSFLSQVTVSADSPNDSPSTFISFIDPDTTYKLVFESAPSFSNGQLVIGLTSGVGATVLVTSDSPKEVLVKNLEGLFTVGETITNLDSPIRSGVLAGIDAS
tara:strand:+ start:188 stop:1195 length:1008 start_codon:yes stop_codon:yes gene_type:complete